MTTKTDTSKPVMTAVPHLGTEADPLCPVGMLYDPASGWCVPPTGWPELQKPTSEPKPTPAPAASSTSTAPVVVIPEITPTPTTVLVPSLPATHYHVDLAPALPPVAGALIGYVALRTPLGAAVGALAGIAYSMLMRKEEPSWQ